MSESRTIAGKTTFFMFLCLLDPSSHRSRRVLWRELGSYFPRSLCLFQRGGDKSDGRKCVDIRVAFLFCFNCGHYLIAVVEASKSVRDRNLWCTGCFDNYLVNPHIVLQMNACSKIIPYTRINTGTSLT